MWLLNTWLLAGQGALPPVDFALEVRPLLSDRCFLCHGPGDTSEIGGFRLDLRDEALEDFGGGAPIVPGDPEASTLLARIRSGNERFRMPPPESKLELSDEEIALLERWIAEGASYAEHWSFEAPRHHDAPPVASAGWSRDELDDFVLARIEAAGLQPAPGVDRATWLRRASYDLTGLPPTIDELDVFLAGDDPADFEREVDRLLASPRHAERMATIWLDAARYADTYGYQSDVGRRVWPWRDWVIESYAKNQPYDEFLTWQLAGDLLPEATREQRLATTFNRLHRQTNEGGSTEEEYRVEYVADRVQTLATAAMGLTMECARCHDHKFDPISQEEFYGLFAFFDDIDESGLYSHFTNATPTPALDLPSEEQETKLATLEASVAAIEAQASEIDPSGLPRYPAQALYSFDSLEGEATPNALDPEGPGQVRGGQPLVEGRRGQAVSFSGDDPVLLPGAGHFSRSDPFSIGLELWLPKHYERAVVLHRSRAWTDSGSRGYELLIEDGRASAALIHFWPGDALRVRTQVALPLERWVQLTMTYDGSSRAEGLKLYVDGQPAEVLVVRDHLRRTILGGGIEHLTLGERFRDHGLAGGRIDDLFVAAHELGAGDVARLTEAESLEAFFSATPAEPAQPAGEGLLEALRIARRERDAARDAIPQIMTMESMDGGRSAHVLHRGSYLEPREEVIPHTPAALSAFPADAPRDRLGLARWLTSPEHPLTARVEVNRLWQVAFGSGLVATPEDFGSQGSPPSHPELLDELALDLIESGWDRRALLRRFVLSATYRQSSRASELASEIDPENLLLSHMSRRRLTAEMLRDGALFAAGLLVERTGGPPAKPYQPAGLWQEKSGAVYQPDRGEGLWRRSLYTYWKRTSPPPAMMLLDASKRDVCLVRRQSTTSPLQALLLWNDPQYVEASRELAERVCVSEPTDPRRLELLFRLLTSRRPSASEREGLLELLGAQRDAFEAEPEQAAQLLSVGEAPRDESLDPVQTAAWTVLAQTLLSFDASLTTP